MEFQPHETNTFENCNRPKEVLPSAPPSIELCFFYSLIKLDVEFGANFVQIPRFQWLECLSLLLLSPTQYKMKFAFIETAILFLWMVLVIGQPAAWIELSVF